MRWRDSRKHVSQFAYNLHIFTYILGLEASSDEMERDSSKHVSQFAYNLHIIYIYLHVF